jgi:hypothetical protein
MEDFKMKTRKLSFTEAIQGLRSSLNSEFDVEREIAQILLDQHYGQRGCINNTKGDRNETPNEHPDRIQHKHIQ